MPHRSKPPIVIQSRLPDLRFSEPREFDGQFIYGREASWAFVYRKVVRQAMEHFGTLDELKKNCNINRQRIVHGYKPIGNFVYMEDSDITVLYYQDANNTCHDIIGLAKGAGINLDIEFVNMEQQSHLLVPSRRCILVIRPKNAILLIQFSTWRRPDRDQAAAVERIYSLPV